MVDICLLYERIFIYEQSLPLMSLVSVFFGSKVLVSISLKLVNVAPGIIHLAYCFSNMTPNRTPGAASTPCVYVC